MRTINVKGTGEVTVAPDLIYASINVNGVEKTYADAIKKSAETTNLLKEAIKRTGLEPSILKTTKLSIRPKHERYQDRKGWKEKFVGFQYAHKLSLEFDNDNKILGKVLYELANFGGESTFNIDYTVKDVESVRNELLKKAVEDSKRKAEVLAYAAKVKQKRSRGEWIETWGMIVDPEKTEVGFAFTLVGCPLAEYAKK